MTTKVFGVDMEVLQKLYQFQFLLKKRRLSKAFDKMEFLSYVQVTSEITKTPAIIPISVVNTSVLIEEGLITIPKCRILRIQKNEGKNQLLLKFKRPISLIGGFIYFDFKSKNDLTDFINAVGEIESDESDSEEITPASSDENSN